MIRQQSRRALLPGEHGLLEVVHAIVAAFEGEPTQLQEHRTRRGVDQVVAQRYLHHRARAFGDRDRREGRYTFHYLDIIPLEPIVERWLANRCVRFPREGGMLVGLRGVCLPPLPTDRDSGGDGEATSSVGHGVYITAVRERDRANDRQAEACTSSVTRGFSVTEAL